MSNLKRQADHYTGPTEAQVQQASICRTEEQQSQVLWIWGFDALARLDFCQNVS